MKSLARTGVLIAALVLLWQALYGWAGEAALASPAATLAYTNFDNATMYPLILLILLASVAVNGVLSMWEQRLLARRGMR